MTELVPATCIVAVPRATNANTDDQLLQSWLASLNSPNSRRNFDQTARRFLANLGIGLRTATIEDVRSALDAITEGLAASSRRQYVLRIKSLLGYGHQLGYLPFDAGVTIKVRSEGHRGAALAKRIISETEVALLIRAAKEHRHRVLLQVAYGGGIRVSELVSLNWGDVIERNASVQLSIVGKGGAIRNVLLPLEPSRALLSLGRRGDTDPVFVNRSGQRSTTRAVHAMVKRAAHTAGVTGKVSPHWLRHAHGSHALDNGATLAEVQQTLGHANVATTSGYLHARPDSSSGLKLDPGIFSTEIIDS